MLYRDHLHKGNLARAQSLLVCSALLCIIATPMWAQTPAAPQAQQAAPGSKAHGGSKLAGTPTRFEPPLMPRRAQMYYESVWGVDGLTVKVAESGELIRFSYRVLDPERAKILNDKKFEPSLIFPGGHVTLSIPSLEKVGQLRQSSTPEAAKSYWMAFSNPGRVVKRGDRVDISVGTFRAEGLVVQ
jgi:hypothetical protein